MIMMVKWGFSYGDLKNMPLHEFFEYIDLIKEYNEDQEAQRKAQETGQIDAGDAPKSIGMVNPAAF
jgi:hypothetical protein